MAEQIIGLSGVGLRYFLSHDKNSTVQEYLIRLLNGTKRQGAYFWALKDVTFTMNKGEAVGIVGLNGSGKSTLLKIIAGIMKPTEGTVFVKGKVVPLIELGAGFDMELTGQENIYLNASILGLSRKQINAAFDNIVEFSELANFIYTPLKCYSSGMIARLAFSIAINVDGDILVVDETLSVGDEGFREKCKKEIDRILSSGVSLLFVSHSMEEVQKLCSRAIWIEQGRVLLNADAGFVGRSYLLRFNNRVFYDVDETSFYKKYIEALFLYGIAIGSSYEGRRYYNPNNNVTKAEFAVFVHKSLSLKLSKPQRCYFADVSDTHWAAGFIYGASNKGLFDEIKDKNEKSYFYPDDMLTARQLKHTLSCIDDEKTEKVIPSQSILSDKETINRAELAKLLCEFFNLSLK
ncbi:teichoic acid ABC transporter ATP-binding protein [Candidatus Magnetoovum chiemensis]|nr:teichoic acid ABC transporter ATP-binding protein [Candidatus Magnetoovum chiemensis]